MANGSNSQYLLEALRLRAEHELSGEALLLRHQKCKQYHRQETWVRRERWEGVGADGQKKTRSACALNMIKYKSGTAREARTIGLGLGLDTRTRQAIVPFKWLLESAHVKN